MAPNYTYSMLYPQYNYMNQCQNGWYGFQFPSVSTSNSSITVPLASAADTTTSTPKLNITPNQEKIMRKSVANAMLQEGGENLATGAAMTGTMAAAPLVYHTKDAANLENSVNMFFEIKNGKAVHADLFQNYTDETLNAMAEHQKLVKKYNTLIKRAGNNTEIVKILEEDLKKFNEQMSQALNAPVSAENGLAERASRMKAVTEDFKVANQQSVKKFEGIRSWFRSQFVKEGTQTNAKVSKVTSKKMCLKAGARAAEAKKAAAEAGKIYQESAKSGLGFKSSFGGKTAFGGTILMAGISLAMDYSKIKEAEAIDKANAADPNKKNTNLKSEQIKISTIKAGSMAGAYAVGDAIGKTAAKWAIKKCAGKVAASVAGRGIGAAIGSCVPYVGTAVGFIVGWGIGELWDHFVFKGKDDKVTAYKADNMSQEELLAYCNEQKKNIAA